MSTRTAARVAAFVTAATILAACQDSPVASGRSIYDLSKVKITTGTGALPNIDAHRTRHPAVSQPRFVCDPDYGCGPSPRPEATFDYGSYTEQSTSGSSKSVHLVAWSDNYAHIATMSVTGSFKSVGGSGAQGCSATPAQFATETASGIGSVWGNHRTLFVERTGTYASSGTYVWQVDGTHYFQADLGYSVDGYYRSGTFYSSARTCY
jgi:hypothetical protein